MIETTKAFEGTHGAQLHYHAWQPEGAARALVAVIHGVGEHIGRYSNVVHHLLPAGYAIAGYDQRGHGKSEGARGHIHSWDEYRLDLDSFLTMIRNDLPRLPLFLYTHSMGSLVGLDYLEGRPPGIKGAVISGAPLEPIDAAPPLLKLLARMMSRVNPQFTMRAPLEGKGLSRDPIVAKAYETDPLVHDQRSARWGAESLRVIESIKSRVGEIELPVLFIHGEKDQVVSVAGSRFLFENVRSPDKTMYIYPDGMHEPHNDIDHEQVMDDIQAWLDAHLN